MYTYMDGVEVDVDSLEPISSPINPNQTYVLSTKNKLNTNDWDIPKAETPIEPTGWGTDAEEIVHDVYMNVKHRQSSISSLVREWRMRPTHITSRLKWRR
jgi:hypothetical protein